MEKSSLLREKVMGLMAVMDLLTQWANLIQEREIETHKINKASTAIQILVSTQAE